MLRSLLLAACLAVVPAAALAQPSPAPSPVPLPPKPDLTPLSFLVGTWNCTEKSSRRPAPLTSSVTWSLDPTGYWLVGKTTTPGAAWFPHPSVGTDMITYDAFTKRWIDIYTSTVGDYDLSTSSGPSGGTIAWHSLGFMPNSEMSSVTDVRQAFPTRTSSSFTYSFVAGNGQNVTVNGNCTKT